LAAASAWPALLEARELRRSFGGGMGEGDDMATARRGERGQRQAAAGLSGGSGSGRGRG
jgi:hypothetical protein